MCRNIESDQSIKLRETDMSKVGESPGIGRKN